jgi:hypothetical protein
VDGALRRPRLPHAGRAQSRMQDGKIRVLFIPSGGFTAGDSAARCPCQPN